MTIKLSYIEFFKSVRKKILKLIQSPTPALHHSLSPPFPQNSIPKFSIIHSKGGQKSSRSHKSASQNKTLWLMIVSFSIQSLTSSNPFHRPFLQSFSSLILINILCQSFSGPPSVIFCHLPNLPFSPPIDHQLIRTNT